jgi:hypothetical protein
MFVFTCVTFHRGIVGVEPNRRVRSHENVTKCHFVSSGSLLILGHANAVHHLLLSVRHRNAGLVQHLGILASSTRGMAGQGSRFGNAASRKRTVETRPVVPVAQTRDLAFRVAHVGLIRGVAHSAYVVEISARIRRPSKSADIRRLCCTLFRLDSIAPFLWRALSGCDGARKTAKGKGKAAASSTGSFNH